MSARDPPTLDEHEEYCYPNWASLPDVLIIHIFTFLDAKSLCRASLCCKFWYRLAFDELLWKGLFHRHWKIHPSIPLAPGKQSWVQEYKRLFYHTPAVESEVFKVHTDEVLHVSFSHNGKMFATTSKDSSIKVWNLSFPTCLRYETDMKAYLSQYTAISEFNLSDSVLLVSGQRRELPLYNLSGYIAFFGLGESLTLLKCMTTSPFESFGYWFNEQYILHGNQEKTNQHECSSQFFLSTADTQSTTENETLKKRLFKFKDVKPSLVRKLMTVYNINQKSNTVSISPNDQETFARNEEILNSKGSHIKEHNEKRSLDFSDNVQEEQKCENDYLSDRFASLELDNVASKKSLSASTASDECERETIAAEKIFMKESNMQTEVCEVNQASTVKSTFGNANEKNTKMIIPAEQLGQTELNKLQNASGQNLEKSQVNSMQNPPVLSRNDALTYTDPNKQHSNFHAVIDSHKSIQSDQTKQKTLRAAEKGIIYTTGSKVRTPHQIGIKKVNHLSENIVPFADGDDNSEGNDNYDETDNLFEIGGHINALRLSPDHRYLFVNSRAWPENYHIEDPFEPPSISEDITVHVIDLVKMQNLGVMYKGHKGYSPNRGCFFIYLDVHDDYVARYQSSRLIESVMGLRPRQGNLSGSEDKQGYLWDRHYGICLQKFPHDEIVNCVAFSPTDPEVLVTVGDDWSIKIWRSLNQQRHIVNTKTKGSGLEQDVIQG